MLVTPHSKINFCVLDHNNFRKDTTVGEKKLDLSRLLTCFNGVLQNVEVTLDLTNESKQSDSPVKVGELVCVLTGLEFRNYVLNSGSGISLAQSNSEITANRTMQEGVRAKIRTSRTEISVPQSSRTLEVHNGLTTSPSTNSVVDPVQNGK